MRKRSLPLGLEKFQRGNRQAGALGQFLLRPALGQAECPQTMTDLAGQIYRIALIKGRYFVHQR